MVGAELISDEVGDGELGETGSWATLDALELVCAPPVLCATPVRGSGFADGSIDDELPVPVDDVDENVGEDGEFEGVADADAEVDIWGRLEGSFSSMDDAADELGESDDEELDGELASDGSASATPGVVATAAPTPRAIANAPTRPTYLTQLWCPINAPGWRGYLARRNYSDDR